MFRRFLLRDLAFAGFTAVFWLLLAQRSAGDAPLADLAGVVAGVLVGISVHLFHEWGHLASALALGAKVRAAGDLRAALTFSFDANENSLAQFLGMSLGGFIATGLAVWGAYAWLPDGWLASRVARGAVLFIASLGVFLELPLVAIALYRRAVPVEAAVKLRGASSVN
jgi:hypothetical protein